MVKSSLDEHFHSNNKSILIHEQILSSDIQNHLDLCVFVIQHDRSLRLTFFSFLFPLLFNVLVCLVSSSLSIYHWFSIHPCFSSMLFCSSQPYIVFTRLFFHLEGQAMFQFFIYSNGSTYLSFHFHFLSLSIPYVSSLSPLVEKNIRKIK